MVIDTSAPGGHSAARSPKPKALMGRLTAAGSRRISAASLLETAIVLEGQSGDRGGEQLDLFLARAQIEIALLTAEQIRIARKSWRRYGKAGGHAAGLNFGDCFSYALAKSLGGELLYKGSNITPADVARS